MKISVPLDPEEMNQKRANAAERALLVFAQDFGETDEWKYLGGLAEQNLADLLADLAHFCDRNQVQMKNCLSIAASHYAEETDHTGTQFRRRSRKRNG
jgi:hypothetical protein